MGISTEELFTLFDKLEIEHKTISHKPLFTVEDGKDIHDKIEGMHCKNLFMKDKKGKIWLIIMPGDKRAHITKLQKDIGSARLSFGKPELLKEILDITPGSVTPFALVNDKSHITTVVLDKDMMEAPKINFHPLRNDASTTIKSDDLMKFIKHLGYDPIIADCGIWAE